ncbi:MAG TPA: TonB family protein [Pyrinomonadaceae bacterium]|nr:TonB family protein [Pyrinomonadaceae bacterium]
MKRCPACDRTYEDDALSFCLEDGTVLLRAEGSAYDPPATIKVPAARVTSDAPTEVMSDDQPARRAGRKSEAPAPARKSSAAPWILGAAVVLGLSAIAVALIMTRGNGANSTEVAQSNQNISASPSDTTAPSLNDDSNSEQLPSSSPVTPNSSPTSRLPTPSPTSSASPGRTPVEQPTPSPTGEVKGTRPGGPISGGVLNGKAISLPKPAYPPIARAARASGQVVVRVVVDESGKVISAQALSGHPLLTESALQAARQARFAPTMLSGQPVKVTGVITYNFVAQ